MVRLLIIFLVCCSTAFAASISIPWFVDNAPVKNDIPGINTGTMSLIFLKSNVNTDLTLSIQYYNQEGTALAPIEDGSGTPYTTFILKAKSALAFRPVVIDPAVNATYPLWSATPGVIESVSGGQESVQGVHVPDRDTSDGRKNGSATISWTGTSSDVQGQITTWFVSTQTPDGAYNVSTSSHLLPPGTD